MREREDSHIFLHGFYYTEGSEKFRSWSGIEGGLEKNVRVSEHKRECVCINIRVANVCECLNICVHACVYSVMR